MPSLLRFFVVSLLALTASWALADTTTRESLSSASVQGNGQSLYPSVSADGSFVAFDSTSTNLVMGDTNFRPDVFVRDRTTGLTTRVSVSSAGVEGAGNAEAASISADGRVVAFMSSSSALVADDTNNVFDIFVHDRQTGQTSRVSISSLGIQGNLDSRNPSVSADGNTVIFESGATNLVTDDTNGAQDVFVHDRSNGQTTRVSVSSGDAQGNGPSGGDPLSRPRLSADGRFAAFQSRASNLVVNDTTGSDVFVRDRLNGLTSRVSVSSEGATASGEAFFPSISADGRFVAFSSAAANLVAGDTNGLEDIFVHDLHTGGTTRVSVSSARTQANGFSTLAAISGNGRFVAFWSLASNLVAGDVNGPFSDVFAHDRLTGQTTLVSVATDGTQGNNDSREPSISRDGRFIAFFSSATTLVPDDTNGVFDVFVRDQPGPLFGDSFE